MTDAAAILRDVYGHGAAKKIAHRFDVALVTAKIWLQGKFPESRTQELAAVVREELDRIDARNNAIRKELGIGGGQLSKKNDAVESNAIHGVSGMGSATNSKVVRKKALETEAMP